MNSLQTAEKFCRFLWHEYLVERNFSKFAEIIDHRLTVIGTGAHEISRNPQEFNDFLKKEEASWNGKFIIESEWYQTTALRDSLYLVIGEIKAKEDAKDRIIYDFYFRFSMIAEVEGDNWKLIHFHQSVPDPNQLNDEFFPHNMIEQSNLQLKRKIDEKTKELEMSNQKVLYNLRHDYLTGLLNRHYLEKSIESAMKKYPYGVLIMMDLDNFKLINDKYGHPFGDRVLMLLAKSMKNIFSEFVTGRIGGDEFIVYIPCGAQDTAFIRPLLHSFLEDWGEMQKELPLQNTISVCMGIARHPEHGKDYQKLWSNADKALYLAKGGGKNGICFYSANGGKPQE